MKADQGIKARQTIRKQETYPSGKIWTINNNRAIVKPKSVKIESDRKPDLPSPSLPSPYFFLYLQ